MKKLSTTITMFPRAITDPPDVIPANPVPFVTTILVSPATLFGRRPEKRYKWEPLKEDVELGNSTYPMVLVQVPMYNERDVNAVEVFMRDVKTSDEAYYLALKVGSQCTESEGENMKAVWSLEAKLVVILVLEFFNSRMDAQRMDGGWSVNEVLQVVIVNCRSWRVDGMKMFTQLHFTYEQESHPEEFFIPYVWKLVLSKCEFEFNATAINFFPADIPTKVRI
ncbi:Glucomannan 4-beta-mannosyltransferase [Vigna angularis]|uniref:Dymeclin n=1 Tax=Phaseolus angularis TaxID=3914 RepID=A0A8T0KYL1_PHAAN|nr:Glucomannan 4-beta-mannosyltransferase [Vigna angularis]